MKNTKILLFAFLSLFLVGCDGIGGVTLTDRKGNKYTFKNQSLTCQEAYQGIYCEGSAIKKDILGKRYVVDFKEEYCKNLSNGEILVISYVLLQKKWVNCNLKKTQFRI